MKDDKHNSFNFVRTVRTYFRAKQRLLIIFDLAFIYVDYMRGQRRVKNISCCLPRCLFCSSTKANQGLASRTESFT